MDSLDPRTHRAVVAMVMHVITDAHLAQRVGTYRALRFGVPDSPFAGCLQLKLSVLEGPTFS